MVVEQEEPGPSKGGQAEPDKDEVEDPPKRVSVTSHASVLEIAGSAFDGAHNYLMNAECSGAYIEEELVSQHWPIFVVLQVLVCTTLWLVYFIMESQQLSGLESSFVGQTLFVLHRDCTDHRLELWRWLSYQFTHAGISHISVNTIILVIAGLPLEGFHGHWRIFMIFNLGVIGGALFQGAVSAHAVGLTGMSAGCYALIAMHWSDMVMNWRQSKFRRMKLMLLVMLIIMDVGMAMLLPKGDHQDVVVSHFSHAGGFVFGFLLSVLIVRNLKVKRGERIGQAVAAILLVAVAAFGGAWLAQWPPKGLFDSAGWCWVRQASNATVFGDHRWRCVQCGDDACISGWTSTQSTLTRVSFEWCTAKGRWA